MINVNKKGFTIIELMIVLAVVAILVALAVPSFQDTIRKSRRSDAMNAILDIHLAQERYRANNTTYGSLFQLGLVASGIIELDSPDDHYKLTIINVAPTTYTITGTAQGDQVNDFCKNFTLAVSAGVITKSVTDGAFTSICWKK